MKKLSAAADSVLWAIVLVPILGVAGYSLYFVARYLGVPKPFAVVMGVCFDGAALLLARYSLKYAESGLSGTLPRFLVRVLAVLSAYLQTLHAKFGHEPRGAAVLWAALPLIAVAVYEVHIRWDRRKALARAGQTYPAPLPSFGLSTWVLFPLNTVTSMRLIIGKRSENVTRAALGIRSSDTSDSPSPIRAKSDSPIRPAKSDPTPRPLPSPTVKSDAAAVSDPTTATSDAGRAEATQSSPIDEGREATGSGKGGQDPLARVTTDGEGGEGNLAPDPGSDRTSDTVRIPAFGQSDVVRPFSSRHAPLKAIRVWAQANGHEVSDSGPLPKAVTEAYWLAHPDAARNGSAVN